HLLVLELGHQDLHRSQGRLIPEVEGREDCVGHRAPSRISASSTSQAPSANPRARSAAARNASRVLPTPPGPTRLTSRLVLSFFLISASSRRRPTKLVVSAGKFPNRWRGLAILQTTINPRTRHPIRNPDDSADKVSGAT